MFRFIAFLRAINVGGGRTVKMQSLRQVFESLGFSRVTTFIASGNVVFETTTKKTKALERKIERALKAVLGYEVRTFVRGECPARSFRERCNLPTCSLSVALPFRRPEHPTHLRLSRCHRSEDAKKDREH
jgi:Protein of unknown function (DUF1697)